MAKAIGLIAALLVFVGWISLVGNPHVVETVIGLVIAAVVGVLVYRKAASLAAKPSK